MSSLPERSAELGSPDPEATASPVINGRYRVVRTLGQGGMGAVHLVVDTQEGDRQLALKRVRGDRLDRRITATLRNEYLALASLEHPGLARVYDFGVDAQTFDYFFTCEFVDGVSLLHACEGMDLSRAADLATFLDLLAQVLRALEFLHAHGFVHGDVKPDNILVTGLRSGGDAGAPRVKLIDLGLTRREKGFGGKRVLGTTHYIAPETISGSQQDRRTDLYSLGCVLYHVMVGRVPFEGRNSIAILKGHMDGSPVPPSQLRPGIPEALGGIVLRLMEKRPSARFQSALETLGALNERLGANEPLETPETYAGYIRCARPGSWRGPLSTLGSVFASVCRVESSEAEKDLNLSCAGLLSAGTEGKPLPAPPSGGCVLLRGEPGLGKRRLVDHFRSIVQTQGACFIPVECGDNPRGLEALLAALRCTVPPGEPVPEPLEACRSLVETDLPPDIHREPLAALVELCLHLLALSHERPLVLHFHDLHRAGPMLMAFLGAMIDCQVKKRMPCHRLMVTATAAAKSRAHDCDLERFLGALPSGGSVLDVSMGRLDAEETAQYLQSVCGGIVVPDAFLDRLFRESDGNPAAVEEIVSALMGRGEIRRTVGGWAFEGDPTSIEIPGRAREGVAQLIARLPEQARSLAVAFAVLGDPAELGLAARLCALSHAEAHESLRLLMEEGLLESQAGEAMLHTYSLAHSSSVDLLLERLDPERRITLHDRAGRLLLEDGRATEEEKAQGLAFHFIRAGDRQHGVHYGWMAGRQLAHTFRTHRALEVYSEVLRLSGGSDAAVADQVRHEIACVHLDTGEYGKALEILLDLAAVRTRDGRDPHPSRVMFDAALACTRLGDFDRAIELLEKAAAAEKQQLIPAWLVHVLVGHADLYFSLGRHQESLRYCHRVLEAREQIHDKKLLVQVYHLLGENCHVLDQRDAAVQHCRDALAVLDSPSDLRFLDAALFFMGCFYKYVGKFSHAAHEFQRCAALRRRRGLLDGEALGLTELGAMEIRLGRPRRALESLKRAVDLCDRTGHLWLGIRASGLLGHAHAELGEYEDSQKRLSESLRLAKQTGNPAVVSASYVVCGGICLDRGDHSNAGKYFAEVEAASAHDAWSQLDVLDLRCEQALRAGRYEKALEVAKRGIDLAKQTKLRARAVPLLERRALVELRLGNLPRALRTAETILETARRYGLPLSVGRAHMIRGLVLQGEGHHEEFARELNEAARIFKAEESERDLVRLFGEYGESLMRGGQLEQALLHLEEASYLAKKLGLSYWKCRVHMALGVLASRMPESDPSKARDSLLLSERIARNSAYLDILWKVQYHLAELHLSRGEDTEASRFWTQAIRNRQILIDPLEEAHRRKYLSLPPSPELDILGEECRKRVAATEVSDVGLFAVAREGSDLLGETYFGLVGQSQAMRRVFTDLASLERGARWIWILGPAGSGKREVGAVIHRQFFEGRGTLWLISGEEIQAGGLEESLDRLEHSRQLPDPDAPEGQDQGRGRQGEFTLIIMGAESLSESLLRTLHDKVSQEASRPDGLRVIALVQTAVAELPPCLRCIPALDGRPRIVLPSLLERWEDVPALVAHFWALEAGPVRQPPILSPEALDVLKGRAWKENLRDLQALCARLCATTRPGAVVGPEAVEAALDGISLVRSI